MDVAQFKIRSISKSHIKVNLDWVCTNLSSATGFGALQHFSKEKTNTGNTATKEMDTRTPSEGGL